MQANPKAGAEIATDKSGLAAVVAAASSALAANTIAPADVEINFDDLKFGRKLGTGTFKEVYSATYRGREVAVGKLKIDTIPETLLAELKHEMDVLKQLRHDNIVEFIGVCTAPNQFCLITELMPCGDLTQYMCRTPRPSVNRTIEIMYDIALGVSYLHTRRPKIIHRDIKPLNILMGIDGRAKLSDFGLSRIRSSSMFSKLTSDVGTPNYMAPELLIGSSTYTERVDVYACGLLIWEILGWSNIYPFADMKTHKIIEEVGRKGYRPSVSHLTENICPKPLLELMIAMWAQHPGNRPSMLQVVDILSQLMN